MKSPIRSLLLVMTMGVSAPVLADGPVAAPSAAVKAQNFEADRTSILAMAGNYKVKFDMRETTPWRADYMPIPNKISGGHEAVRVVEDSGRRIVLQHLLVVDGGGTPMVIKHWRQDWVYEPETVLVYAGSGRWKLDTVPATLRAGRWSQTVYQTDDSPRYGGWGQWTDEGGVRRWRSNWTWRPLARRDAVRHPAYDRYLSINRHSPSPAGWIHWQDNIKMGPEPVTNGKTAKIVPFVQESVLNTYSRDTAFNAAPADAYWQATADYWAAIRAGWDDVIARNGGVTVTEVAEAGSAGAERLMGLADDIQANKIDVVDAKKRGLAVIAQVAGKP